MANAMMVVCDVCGKPATQTVKIQIDARRVEKDLCKKHLDELKEGTRALKRGRKPTLTKVPA